MYLETSPSTAMLMTVVRPRRSDTAPQNPVVNAERIPMHKVIAREKIHSIQPLTLL